MMISSKDAKLIIEDLKPDEKISQMLEFPEFYVCMMVPKESTNQVETGRIFDAIRKKNGEWFDYDITSDPDAYFKAKVII